MTNEKVVKIGTYKCDAKIQIDHINATDMRRKLNLHWVGAEECCEYNDEIKEIVLKPHKNNDKLVTVQRNNIGSGTKIIKLKYDLMSDGTVSNFRIINS